MGNASGVAYDIQDAAIEYKNNNFWTLHNGSHKETAKTVSIFRFLKAGRSDRLPLAQRGIQKLRTLRHPHILTYIDSLEVEESLMLVTEPCVPLEVWLNNKKNELSNPDNSVEEDRDRNLINELTWGLKCILRALEFLHQNCNLTHNSLTTQAIFVSPNHDFKLANFEFSLTAQEKVDVFASFSHFLDKFYLAPELKKIDLSSIDKVELFFRGETANKVDIFAFGQLQSRVLSLSTCTSSFLDRYIAACTQNEANKRPTAKKLLSATPYNSDYCQLLEKVDFLALQRPSEIVLFLQQEKVEFLLLKKEVVTLKLLPTIVRVLQMAITDFNASRDNRENCRLSIVTCLELLGKLAGLKKIDDKALSSQDSSSSSSSLTPQPQPSSSSSSPQSPSLLSTIIQLWAMTDRTIRTALLTQLKTMVDLISVHTLNKGGIFECMLAGFSDSNGRLRESTLMALIYVVDKLDEHNLQDRLVKCVVNLQSSDTEPSIRTNATIFMGKIAAKMKEAVRNRVLCNSLAKSMKDNFVHCRIAGLKTAILCLKLDFLEPVQLAMKILPQTSLLLLDNSAEIRSLGLQLMEMAVNRMKVFHEQKVAERASMKEREGENEKTSTLSGQGGADSSSSWASWSLQGLTKSISSIDSSNTPNNKANNDSSGGNNVKIGELSREGSAMKLQQLGRQKSAATASNSNASKVGGLGRTKPRSSNDDFGTDDDFNFNNNSSSHTHRTTEEDEDLFFETKSFPNTPSVPASSSGWGDDDLDFDVDDEPSSSSKQPVKQARQPPAQVVTKTGSLGTLSATKSSKSASSKETVKDSKVAVKKLEFSKDDDWDDF